MHMLMVVAENGASQVICDQFAKRDRPSSVIFVTTKNAGEYIIATLRVCICHLGLYGILPLILWNVGKGTHKLVDV